MGLLLLLGGTAPARADQATAHVPKASASQSSHQDSQRGHGGTTRRSDEDAHAAVDHSIYSSGAPVSRESILKVIEGLNVGELTKQLLRQMRPSVVDFYLGSWNLLSTLDKTLSNKRLVEAHGHTLFSLLRQDAFGTEALRILQSLDMLGHFGRLRDLFKPFIFHPAHSKRFLGGAAELHALAQLLKEGKLAGMPTYLYKNPVAAGYGAPALPQSLIQVDGFANDENGYQFVEVKAVGDELFVDPAKRVGLDKGFPQTARNAKYLGMPGLVIVSFIKRDGADEYVERLREHVKTKVGREAPMRFAYFNHRQHSHIAERNDRIEPLYEPDVVTVPRVDGPFGENPAFRSLLMRKQRIWSSRAMSLAAKWQWEVEQQGLYSSPLYKKKKRR